MKQIDTRLLDDLTSKAIASPRKRAHHNLHAVLTDPVQRLCVAIEPGTYIRPHRHADPLTWEVFLMLRGSAVFLSFDDSGRVTERLVLEAGGPVHAVEIPAGAWHSIASLETGSVFFEVKQGPYKAPLAENSAAWAPVEGDPECVRFEALYRTAQVGDKPPVASR
ncbi:MAG: WbuC family cupin fold metalloprotein [Nitrospirota bacterium]